jgi:ATP-dependent helicase HrpA
LAKAAGEGRGAKRIARWLMAAEIMETTRIYARTCARIDPHWVLDLGSHLLRVAHSEPFWNAEAGRVLVKERRRLYNLELETCAVSYGRINPAHATEIFIREGLVGDTITWPFDFLAHNRRMREQAETLLTRTRSSGYMNLDEAIYQFYARQISGVSSVAEFVDYVRHRAATGKKFLFLQDDDLRPPADTGHDAAAFPAALPVDNRVLPLTYAYQPGQEADGVTVRVSLTEAEALTPAMLDWAVPGHLPEKVELMLKALPKELRRDLIPLAETTRALVRDLALISARAEPPALAAALAELLSPRLGVRLDPAVWRGKPLPDHLRVRVEVLDTKERVLCASRDLEEIRAQLHLRTRDVSKKAAVVDHQGWRAAREKWETEPAGGWEFGDLPARIVVSEQHGVPVLAYPGLKAMAAGAAVRLFATPEEAAAETRTGLAQLFETQLRFDLGWLERDLKALRMLGPLAVTLTTPDALQQDAMESIRRWVCDAERIGRAGGPLPAKGGGTESAPYQLTKAAFDRAIETAKRDLRGVVPRLSEWLKEIFTLRLALETHPQPYPGLADDLAALLPRDFLRRTPFKQMAQLPRYLRGRQIRADRWKRDAAKDAQRAGELAPFVNVGVDSGDHRAGDFRWLVEEFRVSLFAQELGTAEPVSAVRLNRLLAELKSGRPIPGGKEEKEAIPAAPIPRQAKGAPLKSLGALDQLFRK